MNRGTIDPRTGHPDHVESAQNAGVAVEHSIGNDVIAHRRQAPDEGLTPDAGKLVNRGAAPEYGSILDGHVPRKHDIVGKDDVVAEAAVMRHVRIGQEQVVVADNGCAAMLHRTRIHGHAFADGTVFANHQFRIQGAVVHTLRIAADDGTRKDLRALADARMADDRDVTQNFDVIRKNDIRPDVAERADLHVFADYRTVLDGRGRVDLRT